LLFALGIIQLPENTFKNSKAMIVCVKYLYNKCRIFQQLFSPFPLKFAKKWIHHNTFHLVFRTILLKFLIILISCAHRPCYVPISGILVALYKVNRFHVAPLTETKIRFLLSVTSSQECCSEIAGNQQLKGDGHYAHNGKNTCHRSYH